MPTSELEKIGKRLKRADSSLSYICENITKIRDVSISHRYDTTNKQYIWSVNITPEIENDIDLAISEFLHHVNSTLDNIAWHLACESNAGAPPNNPDRLYYPAKNTANEYSSYENLYFSNLLPVKKQLLEISQPYNPSKYGVGNEHPIKLLKKFSNLDKHRSMHVIGVQYIGFSFNADSVIGSVRITPPKDSFKVLRGVLKSGDFFWLNWDGPFPFPIGSQTFFAFDSVFDTDEVSGGDFIQAKLAMIYAFVQDIFNELVKC